MKQENLIKCDLLVVGSGSAGMSAALKAGHEGLSVIVVDKDKYLGGTTAISAGWSWVPGNKQGQANGDTREEVLSYLKSLSPQTFNEEGVGAFLDSVPEALDFLENETAVKFVYPDKAPDYQMDLPGAKEGGRAIIPADTDARILGPDRLRMQPYLSSYTVFGYMPQVGPDIAQFVQVNQSLEAFGYVSRKLLRTWKDTALYKRPVIRTNGNALMTLMVKSAQDLGIRMWTSTEVTELVQDRHTGAVIGAQLAGEQTGLIHAKVGVVLASGGFSGNEGLRKKYFPHCQVKDDHFSPTIGHDGDALKLSAPVGGHIAAEVSDVGSWAPITVFEFLKDKSQRLFPHLRAFGLPGLIAVDRYGKRFANESLSYHDFGNAMIKHNQHEPDAYGWIIADEKAMHQYGIGYAKPWPMPRGYFFRNKYLRKAATLEALAKDIGVDFQGLQETIEEFNRGAIEGVDPKFGRGATAYQNFKGDMNHKPNPNLAVLDKAPWYAVKVQMGDIGTFAGLKVNVHNQVLTQNSEPVEGLFAVGAAAESVFGGGYPGYGSHIGPALVFGYRVGRDAAKLAATAANAMS